MQRQMIDTINRVRKNPSSFIPLLQKQIQSFTNEIQLPLNQQIVYETNEGKKAWLQALKYLKQQKSIDPLLEHEGLMRSAKDHALDLSRNNTYGHTGSDGSSFCDRILKYCRKGPGSMAQLIGADFNYSNRNHAEMTILGLIIDDGVLDRGHRNTIFNPLYRFIGCKSEVQSDKVITVINLIENNLPLRTNSIVQNSQSKIQKTKQNQSPINYISKISKQSSIQKDNKEDKFLRTQLISQTKKSQKTSYFTLNAQKQESPKYSQTSDNFRNLVFNKQSGLASSSSQGRKLKEKKQSSKIYYEQGSKITQVTIQLLYNDGTIEQKVQKHTVYLQE